MWQIDQYKRYLIVNCLRQQHSNFSFAAGEMNRSDQTSFLCSIQSHWWIKIYQHLIATSSTVNCTCTVRTILFEFERLPLGRRSYNFDRCSLIHLYYSSKEEVEEGWGWGSNKNREIWNWLFTWNSYILIIDTVVYC